MYPWDKELYAYDTVEKLQILAQAMEVDLSMIDYIVSAILEYRGRHPSDPSNLTDDEVKKYQIGEYRERLWHEMQVRREKRKLENLIFGQTGTKSYFVTIGLDDKQFKDDNEAMIINPLLKKIIDTPGFENIKFVVEKYRRNEQGDIYVHRHIHLLFDSNLRKSKVIQFCFQKAKKYVAGQNFIDVKLDIGRTREKYINGQKTQTKLECVEKDRSWRKEKKITEQE